MVDKSIATLVDELLAAEKLLMGIPAWEIGTGDKKRRLNWPVLVGGESALCNVAADAYPYHPEFRFSITLNFKDHNIWRIDWDPPGDMHVNSMEPGHPYSGMSFDGPHCHSWDINRHNATHATIPSPLKWRKPLPDNLRTWDSTFRWFLGEVNIAQPQSIPDLPGREDLL